MRPRCGSLPRFSGFSPPLRPLWAGLRRIWLGGAGEPLCSNVYSVAQLKTIQMTLTVFGVFSVVYLQQAITWIRTMS
jgi:hypothetical protein